MKIIALDSSGLVASVAIVTEEELIAEYTINYKKTHSQTLLPMLDEIIKMVELDFTQVEAIAVAGGPGSFTGLRIGSATAKGLGLALEKPIIAVPTIEGIAYNLYGTDKVICPLMDARRNQVYTGLYEFTKDNKFMILQSQIAIGIEEIIEQINRLNREVIFLGDGVPVQKEIIEKNVIVPYSYAPSHLSRQRAGSIGALAINYYKEEKFCKAKDHVPNYLRLSQAERELKEKKANQK